MILYAVLAVIIAVVAWTVMRLDCDLTLLWCLKYGKKPSEVFAGKIVWITGSSSGIGEALAYQFAAAGSRLVLSARREDLLIQVKQNCLRLSGGKLKDEDIIVQPLDLLELDSHRGVAETVIKYFKKVDVLVNNAGRSQRAVIMDTSVTVDQQVIRLDLLAPISLTKAVLPYMVDKGQGHVMCTSSVAGKYSAPGSATYTAAKHGIQGYFDTLRIELATSGIGVTLACPGPVFSDALIHAFTDKPNEKLNVHMEKNWSRMTATRCAELMVVAAANQLHEAWVSPQPELAYCYLFQYAPYFAKKIAVKLGQSRMNKVKSGIGNLH